jgi:hypothetical protein
MLLIGRKKITRTSAVDKKNIFLFVSITPSVINVLAVLRLSEPSIGSSLFCLL